MHLIVRRNGISLSVRPSRTRISKFTLWINDQKTLTNLNMIAEYWFMETLLQRNKKQLNCIEANWLVMFNRSVSRLFIPNLISISSTIKLAALRPPKMAFISKLLDWKIIFIIKYVHELMLVIHIQIIHNRVDFEVVRGTSTVWTYV